MTASDLVADGCKCRNRQSIDNAVTQFALPNNTGFFKPSPVILPSRFKFLLG